MVHLSDQLGVVVIGRNEGERLKLCIESLLVQKVKIIVYVDSGSTDGSIDYAFSKDIDVVELDTTQGFTMARGRNAGLSRLTESYPHITYVQFVDGDCELASHWIEAGLKFIESRSDVVSVCGVLKEKFPEFSVYNHLLDLEWQGVTGEIKACGGIAIFRVKNLLILSGFHPGMIAGEEAELCVRLRKQGGVIWRLDVIMATHDANMRSFSQWWKRAVRCGHAYAEGFVMHGRAPEFHNRRSVMSGIFYGLFLPLVMVFLLILTLSIDSQYIRFVTWLWAGFLALAWLKVCFSSYRYRRRLGNNLPDSILYGIFVLLAKLPEAQGILVYIKNRIFGRALTLIEYRQDKSA